MYVVIANQTGLSSNVASTAIIRLVTKDPYHALKIARQTWTDNNSEYISGVFIYEVELSKCYTLYDFSSIEDSSAKPLVYQSCRSDGEGKYVETFFPVFQAFNQKKIDRKDKIAAPGKFRAIMMADSDAYYHLGEDTEDPETAYLLCVRATEENGYPFAVFNDQGIVQTKDGFLISFLN